MATAIAAHMSTEETTPTPQGDGNSLPGVSLASMIWETTPTPQGDGN